MRQCFICKHEYDETKHNNIFFADREEDDLGTRKISYISKIAFKKDG